ncbi:fibronectin type III domain-containing protein [Gracilibacillus caseinilyticus]|uniref:Fibronectin type III domain-containing protein n=1 Tax=Gracilibacillus caseinilyticus TaxID=2932256 RepID=A0ABY4ETX3_9BACI|nr:fibronectin type III domain-containing protein [Gracilibacillus caseinilyticus]UOQ47222.1 fibronectin type III domain-containing protein [Gracilibacillus caseinilyticus]
MKKFSVLLFGVVLFLILIPFSNVFAAEFDYNDGLLDDPSNVLSSSMPSEFYDNDLETGRKIYAHNYYDIQLNGKFHIDSMYLKATTGYSKIQLFANNEMVFYESSAGTSIDELIEVNKDDVDLIRVYQPSTTSNATVYELDAFGYKTGQLSIPNNVTNLKAVPGGKKAELSWTNPTGTGFQSVSIYQGDNLLVENVTEESYTVEGLNFNTSYTFKVVSVGADGNSSGQTVEVTTKAEPDTDGDGIPDSEDQYPDDPENIPPPETTEDVPEVEELKIEATPERVDLSWKNPPRYFEKATIYRKVTGTATAASFNLNPFAPITVQAAEDYEPLFETNGTTFGDLSVKENEEYEYKVTNTYNGLESAGVTVQASIPEPPLVDTTGATLPFGIGELIASGNGLLNLIGGFVLLALAFVFVPKVIGLIRQSFISNATGQATDNRLTERQQKMIVGQGRQPRQGRS